MKYSTETAKESPMMDTSKWGEWLEQAIGEHEFPASASVEEHILCHKGAYMGKNGITRDRTGKLWYYRNLKR